MSTHSNFADVARAILDVPQVFNMRRPASSEHGSVGQALIGNVAVAMRRRTYENQTSPNGQPLKELKPRYLRRKIREGYSYRRLVRTGNMLALRNFIGRQTITQRTASTVFGMDEASQEKAEFATEGGKKQNRPPREFIGLGKEETEAADEFLDREAQAYLESL